MIPRRSAQRVNARSIPAAALLPGRIVVLALVFALGIAHAQTVDKDGIDYITGGVGSDEMERLQAREREFNLKLVFTLAEGNYVSDVAVVVKNKAGNPVLVLHAPGPLVLAKLPRGAYVVEATYEGRTQTRRIDVNERMRTEYVRWPSNPETDFPGPKATDRD